MLKKNRHSQINIKGLRKKIRRIAYENFLLTYPYSSRGCESFTPQKGAQLEKTALIDKKLATNSLGVPFIAALNNTAGVSAGVAASKIFVLRSAVLADSNKTKLGAKTSLIKTSNLSNQIVSMALCSKCIKKSIFKKVLTSKMCLETLASKNVVHADKPDSGVTSPSVSVAASTDSKFLVEQHGLMKLPTASNYIYWMSQTNQLAPIVPLKEQLIQLNFLKSVIKAEPRDSFLGCLIVHSDVITTSTKDNTGSEPVVSTSYKYYYPAQILSICDLIPTEGWPELTAKVETPDVASGVSASVTWSNLPSLEILKLLLQTLELGVLSPILSISNILATSKSDAAHRG